MPILRDARLDLSRVEDAEVFPFALPAVRALRERLTFHPKVTFLIGENGAGKSTILEALAAKLELDTYGGDTNFTLVKHGLIRRSTKRSSLLAVRAARP